MTTKASDHFSFKVLGCFKRRFKSGHLAPPVDVEKIFHTYAENEILTPEKLKAFLVDVQGETAVTLEDAKKIVDHQLTQQKHSRTKVQDGLPLDAFFHYLLDPTDNLAHSIKVHHDMTLPASHYYIYTGHNSYLTGNQLSSDCSEKPIIDALRRGVRVIELDLWPNKNEDGIDVLHGGTMTSPVRFETCIAAIRDHAFEASQYPVVITFEDHLTPELQAKCAEITTRVLGKLLKIPDETEKFTEFPSPDAIKGRILISTKPPREYLKGKKEHDALAPKVDNVAEKVENKKGRLGTNVPPVKKTSDWGDEIPDFNVAVEHAKVNSPVDTKVDRSVDPKDDSDTCEESDDDEDAPADNATNPEYKKIISIRAGKPKGASLTGSLVVDDFVKRVSFSEPQLEKVAKKRPSALIEFTQRNLLRVYPYGLRFNSSNYNPLVAWSHGAQMVAFNMQGYGRPLWLVHGFFRANGGCGYVRKPKFLFPSENGIVFDPRKELPPKVTLRVKVIMGLGWLEKFGKHHFDNFSPPDFYTRVGIAGVPADTIMKKTETLEDDWLPKWETQFDFPLSVPELALLRVEVHEYDRTDKDDFAGQTCFPVTEIKRGFRCVPLQDKKGFALEGVRLLFHFEIIPLTS